MHQTYPLAEGCFQHGLAFLNINFDTDWFEPDNMRHLLGHGLPFG
jgi:hypothetical protein